MFVFIIEIKVYFFELANKNLTCIMFFIHNLNDSIFSRPIESKMSVNFRYKLIIT